MSDGGGGNSDHFSQFRLRTDDFDQNGQASLNRAPGGGSTGSRARRLERLTKGPAGLLEASQAPVALGDVHVLLGSVEKPGEPQEVPDEGLGEGATGGGAHPSLA